MTTAAADPTTNQIPTHSRGSTFGALRIPDYRLYLAGQSIANTGTWLHSVAQNWLVLELTGSATAVGITLALQSRPMLLLGLVGGTIADRYPK